ncbi:MAG: ankyrin repeat domain-containing protein [Acidobacteriales bacterium]|nr:ankyrin repeat domain-containing protein [Terriglobales bacterium]
MRSHNGIVLLSLLLCVLYVTPGFAQFGQRQGQRNGPGNLNISPADRQLYQAAFDGDMDGLKAAMQAGANVNSKGRGDFSPLIAAARNGHLDVVKYLVEHGADVDDKDNSRDKTALLAAAFRLHPDIVQYLAEHGADINAQAINGFTPLHDAAFVGDVATVKYLVDKGARLDLKNKHGQTALECAIQGSKMAPAHGRTTATPADYKEVEDYLRAHMK